MPTCGVRPQFFRHSDLVRPTSLDDDTYRRRGFGEGRIFIHNEIVLTFSRLSSAEGQKPKCMPIYRNLTSTELDPNLDLEDHITSQLWTFFTTYRVRHFSE